MVVPLLDHLDIFHRVVRARRNDDASPLGNRVRAAYAYARSLAYRTARNVCIMQSPTIDALNDLPHSNLMPARSPFGMSHRGIRARSLLYLSRGYPKRRAICTPRVSVNQVKERNRGSPLLKNAFGPSFRKKKKKKQLHLLYYVLFSLSKSIS